MKNVLQIMKTNIGLRQWNVDISVCRRFGLSTFRSVDVLVCRRFGLSTCWFIDVLVCRCFGLSTFWSVDVSVCRRFGLSTFWFSTFRFVDVLTMRSYRIWCLFPPSHDTFRCLYRDGTIRAANLWKLTSVTIWYNFKIFSNISPNFSIFTR